MGTSVRTRVEVTKEVWEREDIDAGEQGVVNSVVTTWVVMVYSPVWFYGVCAQK